jgi:hypothetical protein
MPTQEKTDKIAEVVEEILTTLKDYPESDPYEVAEELLRLIAADDDLSFTEIMMIRTLLQTKVC